jgi:predicted phage terminase large subunit-like protein
LAWINDRWVDREERSEIIDTYREYLAVIDAKYPDADDMPVDVAADYFEKMKELQRLERIHRCEVSLLDFALEYFGEAKNPGNDGNWEGFDITDVSQAPAFHKEITDIMNVVSTEEINAKIAVAAPRSHAKSSYLSKAFPVHEVVYRKRKYVIIISETPKVSKANMEWIRNQLKYNRKLREDFGPLLSPKDQANIMDNGEGFIAWHPDGDTRKQIALVEAASTGQALRGRNWNGSRPDLLVLDDLEDARPGGNASTPEQRQALRDWFSQTVIPLGDPKGKRTAFVYMGTTVHHDALLMHVLHKRSDFKSKVYRAIIQPPERQDLWEQCRLIYNDHEDPDRLAKAKAFYEANKDEMLRGSKVLWPEVQPLWKLMTWKWDNGSKAFNTEYMNNPIDEESMIFNPEHFTYWDDKEPNRVFDHADYDIYMGVDFAMGKERGDYSAISVVAKHKQTGVIYVVDSYGDRVKPDKFIKDVCEMAVKWQPDKIAAEAQMAQEFFVDQLKEHLEAKRYPAFKRVEKIHQRSRKELRIEAMLPDIESGKIQFCRKHALLLEQFERYGTGEHDDLPDSLEMAISITKKAKVRVIDKPIWL